MLIVWRPPRGGADTHVIIDALTASIAHGVARGPSPIRTTEPSSGKSSPLPKAPLKPSVQCDSFACSTVVAVRRGVSALLYSKLHGHAANEHSHAALTTSRHPPSKT